MIIFDNIKKSRYNVKRHKKYKLPKHTKIVYVVGGIMRSRLNLVIAGKDEEYIKNLAGFVLDSYSKRFEICCFGQKETLLTYLMDDNNIIDILLVDDWVYEKNLPVKSVKTTIFLCEGIPLEKSKNHCVINKYQHGHALIAEIINIFSQKNQVKCSIINSKRNTKIVAVFSPSGGAGKTCIAAGCSIQCARKGLSVFYLNMEDISSANLFFGCNSDKNLSNILYYLKEKKESLILNIEGIRCVHPDYKVHYFLSPDSVQDINEVVADEVRFLIHQLRIMNEYDVVFIDMSSSLNANNIAILEECDNIIFIVTQDRISNYKTKVILNEFDIISKGNSKYFPDKINMVVNKCTDINPSEIDDTLVFEDKNKITLPLHEGLSSLTNLLTVMDGNNEFSKGIQELSSRYL